MLELLVVMSVMTMAVGLFSSTLVSTSRQSRAKRELSIAAEAARRALEIMRSQPAEQLFALYNAIPGDDPGGAGTAPGPHFAVPGLDLRDLDADGFAGRVTLPGSDALREDFVDAALGLPRDLNGDQQIDSANHAGDYILLPVRVRIEWKGVAGDTSFDLYCQFVQP